MATPCPQPKTYDELTNRELDSALDQKTISTIWHYAKQNYSSKGIPPHEAVRDMAKKFGLPERVLSYALDKPKSLRRVSDESRQAMRDTARFLTANKKYLANFDRTMAGKLIVGTAEGIRGSILTAHGPVTTPIHGINILYTNPVKFLRAYGRGVMALSEDGVDNFMASMTETPKKAETYKILLDAGANIGKQDTSDWMTAHGFLQKIGEKFDIEKLKQRSWAAKTMDAALKPLRFEIMSDQWDNLRMPFQQPDAALKNDTSAKLIAGLYNHATGALGRKDPAMRNTSLLSRVLMARQLTIGNIMALVDVGKTGYTWYRLGESRIPGIGTRPPSPEEIAVAWGHTKFVGKYLGTMIGSLLVSQAFLKATGSNQKINWTDPTKSDWLAYKAFGYYWRPRGIMELVRLVAHFIAAGDPYGKKPFGKSPEETFGRYAEYKLHPAFGAAGELMYGRDIFGRPVPWSHEPGTAKFPRLGWLEYGAQRGPIFLGHAVQAAYDGAREQGIPDPSIKQVMGAMIKHPEIIAKTALTGTAEFFGFNLQPDLSVRETGGGARPAPSRPLRPQRPVR